MSTNGPVRRRRGSVAREEALEAARDLLLSGGPAAVTLKAVGQRMGVGHANLIHHFGSAAGLQGALMDAMVRDLARRIEDGLGEGRADVEPGRLMTVVFDAFGKGGASQMAAWLALAREQGRAESFAQVVRDLAERLAAMAPDDSRAAERARSLVMTAAYMAFAEGLIGDILTPMLGAPQGLGQDLALKLTATLLAEP
ncbi:TetR/AcrR family transcriptional regulator [Brevundimonas sp. SORGH_AS_0993]|uniref:TetR/AcrR family transcriptional regulator n=1 Tax=Brevundimonas sp. SORGH_AS_0993 TaxID=3041794 RepID=UPI00277D7439|nr:helix-turn-helix domain-containing protein [Brevundimonas sp. SORGH_AS_0993]MDQ1154307.1 AcrR family transcriptional regulator [Brevundimonas sp. SORGH_AS_0993]